MNGFDLEMTALAGGSIIPFLIIAEPLVFILCRGAQFCHRLCFQPAITGVVTVWKPEERWRVDSPQDETIDNSSVAANDVVSIGSFTGELYAFDPTRY